MAALIRFFSSVCPQMTFKIGTFRKRLVTMVVLIVFISSMYLDMAYKMSINCKTFVTVAALICSNCIFVKKTHHNSCNCTVSRQYVISCDIKVC